MLRLRRFTMVLQSWLVVGYRGSLRSLFESPQVEVVAVSIKTSIVLAQEYAVFQDVQTHQLHHRVKIEVVGHGSDSHGWVLLAFVFDKLSTVDVSEHDSTSWSQEGCCFLKGLSGVAEELDGTIEHKGIVQRS